VYLREVSSAGFELRLGKQHAQQQGLMHGDGASTTDRGGLLIGYHMLLSVKITSHGACYSVGSFLCQRKLQGRQFSFFQPRLVSSLRFAVCLAWNRLRHQHNNRTPDRGFILPRTAGSTIHVPPATIRTRRHTTSSTNVSCSQNPCQPYI
jgi:hypothetical protein